MQIGTRFRCYPSKAQGQILLQWIGCQRHIYNAKVGEDRYFRSFARKSLAHTGTFAPIDQQYSHFKTDLTSWLSEVPSQILRNGATKWKQAYARYFQKLGGRPCIQKRHGKQSVWLTSELFNFVPKIDTTSGETTYRLHVGTKKFPVGEIVLKAHRTFRPPQSIHISIHAGRWHVSFNYDDEMIEPSEADTIAWLRQHDESELASMTFGLDRGVVVPLVASDGKQFAFGDIQLQRLAKQERHKKRWQRKQARRVKGSGRWLKAKHKVARHQLYGADVRKDFAHKTSHALVSDPHYKLFVYEALKVKNMSASAKGTVDEPGTNVRQKAGLNRSILGSAWGQVKLCTQYKARRAGKLCMEVLPHYSSQECGACGHTHKDNRPIQAEFVCQRCGHADHADINAAKVLALRGVRLVLLGGYGAKKKKQVALRKSKVGAVCSEPAAEVPSPLVETLVSRQDGNIPTHRSLKRETPATRPQGL